MMDFFDILRLPLSTGRDWTALVPSAGGTLSSSPRATQVGVLLGLVDMSPSEDIVLTNAPQTLTNKTLGAGTTWAGAPIPVVAGGLPPGGTAGQTLSKIGNADYAVAWTSAAGTVTSVGLSVPNFLQVAGSPITGAGVFSVTLSGMALPTTSGGTGLTSFTNGGLVQASSSSTLITTLTPAGLTSVNGLGLQANSVGFQISGGTSSETLTVTTSGTLGSAAYTAASAYVPAWSGLTSNGLLVATSATVVGQVTVVDSAVLVSSAGGVPSLSTTLPSGLTIPGYAPTASPTFSGTITVSPFSTAGIVTNNSSGALASLSNASSVSSTLMGILGTSWSNSASLFLTAAGTWAAASGSTGISGATQYGVMIATAATTGTSLGTMAAGQLVIGQTTGSNPAVETVGGDATLSASGSLTVTKSSGTAFGSAAFTSSSSYAPSSGIANSALANSTIVVNGVTLTLGDGSDTVPAAAGTLTGATLASGVTASSLTSVGTLGSLTVTGSVTLSSLTGYGIVSASTAGLLGVASTTGVGDVVLATSPALAGTPSAPTASNGTNTTQIATCAFVLSNAPAAAAGSLTGTTLASNVVSSSITSVGTTLYGTNIILSGTLQLGNGFVSNSGLTVVGSVVIEDSDGTPYQVMCGA